MPHPCSPIRPPLSARTQALLLCVALGLVQACGDADAIMQPDAPPTLCRAVPPRPPADDAPVLMPPPPAVEAVLEETTVEAIEEPHIDEGRRPFLTPSWLAQATNVTVGDMFVAPGGADEVGEKTLAALGFVKLYGPLSLRVADLLKQETLVPSTMNTLPEIDAVAVISTYRPKVRKQYIYPTLRSLFGALPESAEINVLVGDGHAGYLRPAVLAHELGVNRARRVHVLVPPKATAAYLARSKQHVSAKATYNYARALRSYRGSQSLLLCEDDIEMAQDAANILRPYLSQQLTDITILYNDRCEQLAPTWTVPGSRITLDGMRVQRNSGFATTQAILYSSRVARPLGDYLIVRAGREPYDYLTGRYLSAFEPMIAYASPSLVQHKGFVTTGLSASPPQSACYVRAGDLPTLGTEL